MKMKTTLAVMLMIAAALFVITGCSRTNDGTIGNSSPTAPTSSLANDANGLDTQLNGNQTPDQDPTIAKIKQIEGCWKYGLIHNYYVSNARLNYSSESEFLADLPRIGQEINDAWFPGRTEGDNIPITFQMLKDISNSGNVISRLRQINPRLNMSPALAERYDRMFKLCPLSYPVSEEMKNRIKLDMDEGVAYFDKHGTLEDQIGMGILAGTVYRNILNDNDGPYEGIIPPKGSVGTDDWAWEVDCFVWGLTHDPGQAMGWSALAAIGYLLW